MQRLQNLANNLKHDNISASSDNDVVICAAVRTPITKGKRGGLKDTAPEVLLSVALKEVTARANVKQEIVEDIAVGNNSQPGAGEVTSRMASMLAGFPVTTTVMAVNRLCSSGLQACAIIASKIRSGIIDIGIGAGVQSMSVYQINDTVRIDAISELVFQNQKARVCLTPMGETSDNVAKKFNVSRLRQDQFAVESHRRAHYAQTNGLFDSEIVPVTTKVLDKDGKETVVTVTKDDGIRKEVTVEALGKLKPAFSKEGTTTAGNSSQISDGAAAVLFARRSVAKKLGLPILGKFISYAVKGCQPTLMGIGPIYAIPALMEKTNKKISDVDIWQINQAFASQAIYCVDTLGIDYKKVNPKGGAIAFGHPLGCTGARQIATILPELKRTNGKLGVLSMCIGTGMGAAALIERQ